MVSEAEMILVFGDESTAAVVARSLMPDNEPLPRGLSLQMVKEGRRILFKIRCERKVRSLLTTMDDILHMTSLILRVMKSIEGG